jgi:hypothetical protein
MFFEIVKKEAFKGGFVRLEHVYSIRSFFLWKKNKLIFGVKNQIDFWSKKQKIKLIFGVKKIIIKLTFEVKKQINI